jgi:SAM-dependent methyltransferase
MGLREMMIKSDTLVGIIRDARKLVRKPLWAIKGRAEIGKYVASSLVRKLQIGTSGNVMDGWLNTDITPTAGRVCFLDASKRFPIDDGTFDYVFCEHMIEHVSWHDGQIMLKECRRVLKPGGKIRLSTPDLEVQIGLFKKPLSPIQEAYIKQTTDTLIRGVGVYKPSLVINNAFYNWGHRCIYDGDLLETSLRSAGFVDPTRCRTGESEDPNLRGLERHVSPMQVFESLVFEAMCPGG